MLNIYTDENSEGVKVYSPDTEQINDIASIIDLIDEEGGYEGGCLVSVFIHFRKLCFISVTTDRKWSNTKAR